MVELEGQQRVMFLSFVAKMDCTIFKGKHILVINREKIDVPLYPEDDMFIQDSMGNVFEYLK